VIDMVGTNRDPASAIGLSAILPAVTELAPDFVSLLDRNRSVREGVHDGARHPRYRDRADTLSPHEDGTWITLESAARNYMDFPELEGFLVSSRDITQHVALEKTLRQSARDSAELFENAPRRMRSTPRS
jgi:PAS domain-containing protein